MARNKYDVDENLDKKVDFAYMKRALKYTAKYKKQIIIALFLSFIAAFAAQTGPTITQQVIDRAIPNEDMRLLFTLAGMILGVYVISAIFSAIRGLILAKVGQSIVDDIRHDLFEHLQKLPFSYYDSRPHGKILVRVVYYVNNVAEMLSGGLINAAIQLLNIIFILFYMLRMDARLTLVIISGLPVVVVFMIILKPMQRKARLAHNNKNSNMTAFLCENIEGVRVTSAFNRQEFNCEIEKEMGEATRKAWMKTIYVGFWIMFFSDNIAGVINAIMYLLAILVFKPSAEVGVLIAMGMYCWRFWQPITMLANLYNNMQVTLGYLERIFQTMDEPVEIEDAPNAIDIKNAQGIVEFKNVSFEYDKGVRVLNNVSFKVKKGERIALVGPTGAGKSTVVNLISRFYNVAEGKLLIDGVDINKITIKSLRENMGIMLQDSFIFSGTIKENILYGKLNATDEEIYKAAIAVQADEFIQKLSDGYNTEINERGGTLSQGEKQLLSFARTLVADPAILILDEATSSIDTKTENLLQKGIEKLLEGRTSFIIAHRLSTIKNCDKIMFIDNGEITEAGTHDELMELKGRYYELNTTLNMQYD